MNLNKLELAADLSNALMMYLDSGLGSIETIVGHKWEFGEPMIVFVIFVMAYLLQIFGAVPFCRFLLLVLFCALFCVPY